MTNFLSQTYCFEKTIIMNLRNAIKYGSISGLIIVSTWFIGYAISGGESDMMGGELVGYAIMLLALTSIFMGIKSERDKNKGDRFSFRQGFFTGLGIVMVASVIYVIGWMIYMPNFAPDFVDKYAEAQIQAIQDSQATNEAKESQIQEMKGFIENYKRANRPFY